MPIATPMLTCLRIPSAAWTGSTWYITALSVGGIVCIASSNGGTTSQDLKTGYLVGATPKYQQYAILIGALTSAVVIGGTMLALNAGSTHYTKNDLPIAKLKVPEDAPTQKVGQPYTGKDDKDYRLVYAREEESPKNVPPGWYLVDENGQI